ncbi:hypothetical protein EDD37DRAFT_606346 [Exophiala viscosa]|uniref:Cupin type-2 domain-containing protein n=1 Tax=Exophiala viscosa TaxID=2486360 RepID=A0AAN6E7V9_9EURO|nr:hypothetical protein EDD36DRAFT_31016 [Exophiala viscosa]KAI1627540.1 hypothetical protein EDD37DRAFT_606346 [Exophiala viscosa]
MPTNDLITKHTTSSNGTPLRDTTTFITGHSSEAEAVYHSVVPASWQKIRETNHFNVIYTTSEFPVSMDDDKDIDAHDKVMSSGSLGLVRPNGTVCRTVDFAPDGEALMHRTKSLDYGIVVEGEIECHLDSGEVKTMKRGDVAVQRGTMHAWKNASKTEWARMVFVLQDSQPLSVGGKVLKEELGHAEGAIPASGNDQ